MSEAAYLKGENELVLHRFHPVRIYGRLDPPQSELRGVFADVETTGLDPDTDKIIQLALVPFTFSKEGIVCTTEEAFVQYEDPGVPLSPEIQRITGLTDDILKGAQIDDSVVNALVGDAALVVCHNAEFDRPFLEKQFAIFEGLRFGCSMRDVPWEEMGETCVKLEWLAYKRLGVFYDAHHADTDCYVAIALLAQQLGGSGHTGMEAVLAAARKSYVRIYARGTDYETRHILKRRGYRWSSGEDGQPKAWYIDVARGGPGFEEHQWLGKNIYHLAEPDRHLTTVAFDARQRFSNRIGR